MLKSAQVFMRADMHASCLLLMAVDSWGMECVQWEPETLTTAVKDEFGVTLDALNYDKLQAAISLVGSNLYHKSPGAFCAINKAFSFKSVSNSEFNVCSLDDVLWGTTEAKLLEGPEEYVAQGFTHDISRYVGQLLEAEGVTTPPSNLNFAEYNEATTDASNSAEFTDPTAWKMTMQREEGEVEDMNNFMGINLMRLFKQLQVLPLKNSTELQQNIEKMLVTIKEKLGEYADSEDYQP